MLDVARLAAEAGGAATVGQLRAYPGAINVVPGRVELGIDVRAAHDEARDELWEQILDAVHARCARLGLRVVVEELHAAAARHCDLRLRAALGRGIAGAGGPAEPRQLFSWAGHDAMAVARVTAVGMLFVRCAEGISAPPGRGGGYSAYVAAAVDALESAVLELAQAWPA